MVPFRLNPKQFAERFRRSLERSSTQAIATLRTHFALPVEPSVDAAEVQIFIGDDEPHALSVWIYYVGANNKIDSSDPSLHAGRSMELAVGLDQLEEFDPRFFSDEKFGGDHIAADLLKAWFSECWWKAGGWAYPLAVSLQVHDGLGDGKEVKLTEK